MHDYLVFGGALRSDLELPEAIRAPAAEPRWILRTVSVPPPCAVLWRVGAHVFEQDGDEKQEVHLFRTETGYRLSYPDTGSYDIAGGGEIAWCPAPDAPLELVRADILGPVLALALHAEGIFCLHASAVAVDCGAVAFLGPKFHGKSTLALAMAVQGARLITDDTLAVGLGPELACPVAYPGIHSVRLWDDSAEHFAKWHGGAMLDGVKRTMTDFPEARRADGPVELRALYLLDPIRSKRRSAVHRRRAQGAEAALALIAHAKMAPLLGPPLAAAVLEWAVALARSVPVYRLAVPRDYGKLWSAVEQLIAWHSEQGSAWETGSLGGSPS
jgi:hypothetical protein